MFDITPKEISRVRRERVQVQYGLAVSFLNKLLLKGKISLKEIPIEIRIDNLVLYLTDLRISRSLGCQSMIKTLKLLQSDILFANMKGRRTHDLLEVFVSNLKISDDIFRKVDEYVLYRKNIPQEVLQLLSKR